MGRTWGWGNPPHAISSAALEVVDVTAAVTADVVAEDVGDMLKISLSRLSINMGSKHDVKAFIYIFNSHSCGRSKLNFQLQTFQSALKLDYSMSLNR